MRSITVNDIFNPVRFLRLFYLDIRRDWKTLVITLGGVFAFFLLTGLIDGYRHSDADYLYTYMAIFIVGGILLTARAFRHYYRRERNTPLLMLPASKTEKWVEKLLMTTLGWMIGSFIVFTAYAFLSAGINELIFGYHTSPIWWDEILVKFYLHYLVAHSVFFLGASVYKKTVLFKTVLTIFIIGVVLSLFSALFGRIVFQDLFKTVVHLSNNGGNGINIGPGDTTPEVMDFIFRLGKVMQVFYWALIIPFCWVTSFVRFTEIEVKDGV
ncbi:MAG: hypothetical protein JEY99_13195 [Spirochaetales bacterium]|nr:hypothetical protein [Spirochaetales bacterium]